MTGKAENKQKNETRMKAKLSEMEPYMLGFYNFMGDNKTYRTKEEYTKHVIKLLNYVKKDVTEITIDDITSFTESIRIKPNGIELKSSYKISIHSALKQFFSYLYARKTIETNPMDHIKRPSLKESDAPERCCLTPQEVKQMMYNVEVGVGNNRSRIRQKEFMERDRALLLLFLETGARCGAVAEVNLENVDFANNKVYMISKGDKARDYEISDKLLISIAEWIVKRRKILGDIQSEALFCSMHGTRLTHKSISKIVLKYTEFTGKRITPHKLRATTITNVWDATHDLFLAQRVAGHADPKTTEIYIRNQEDSTKAASRIMSDILYG